MNSGAEAVETAIKAVRKWGYEVKGVPEDRAEIIVCEATFTAAPSGWCPFPPTPIPAGASDRSRRASASSPFGYADELEAAITPDTFGFLVEPIQGEAGVIMPPTATCRGCGDLHAGTR